MKSDLLHDSIEFLLIRYGLRQDDLGCHGFLDVTELFNGRISVAPLLRKHADYHGRVGFNRAPHGLQVRLDSVVG